MHAHREAPAIARDQVACWVFDLDNTLYPADCELFAQIDVRMTDYIAALLDVDRSAARHLQKTYYRRHGTTLRGLMLHHDVSPGDYLSFVHDIDLSVVPAAPALGRALAMLTGRKVVFTNGSAAHAERVLDRLGVADQFDRIVDIEAVGYLPKPLPEPYDHLLAALDIAGPDAVLFEDSLANLLPAAERGMRTVWVQSARAGRRPDEDAHAHAFVDHVTDDLTGWLSALLDGVPDGG